MKCCKQPDANPYPLRSEAGWCCGMCIRAPAEQRSSAKFMQAVRCYNDNHPDWAYFRFWRSVQQWPPLATAVGDFYVAAAKNTLDISLRHTNHRYAKRFYARDAARTPTREKLQRLTVQYRLLADCTLHPERAATYRAKARAVAERPAIDGDPARSEAIKTG